MSKNVKIRKPLELLFSLGGRICSAGPIHSFTFYNLVWWTDRGNDRDDITIGSEIIDLGPPRRESNNPYVQNAVFDIDGLNNGSEEEVHLADIGKYKFRKILPHVRVIGRIYNSSLRNGSKISSSVIDFIFADGKTVPAMDLVPMDDLRETTYNGFRYFVLGRSDEPLPGKKLRLLEAKI